MRMRKIDANGDYVFGHSLEDFHVDTPDAVGLLCSERCRLIENEWFLALDDGLPVFTQISGVRTEYIRDAAIRERILGTIGAEEITDYNSVLKRDNRTFNVQARLDTIYGEAEINGAL